MYIHAPGPPRRPGPPNVRQRLYQARERRKLAESQALLLHRAMARWAMGQFGDPFYLAPSWWNAQVLWVYKAPIGPL